MFFSIPPIQLEYWNLYTISGRITELKDSTDTIGVLKLIRLRNSSSIFKIPPIQLEYWNYGDVSVGVSVPIIPPIQLEYWNSFCISWRSSFSLNSTDTIGVLKLICCNIFLVSFITYSTDTIGVLKLLSFKEHSINKI